MTNNLNALAIMLRPDVVRNEAHYYVMFANENFDKNFGYLMSLDDATIQSAINEVNPDFDYEDMERGILIDLISSQMIRAAKEVIKYLLDNRE